MAKCHVNRRMRLRRDKKFLRRLAEKRFGRLVLKEKGCSSQYYRVIVTPVVVKIGNRRFFDKKKTLARVIPKKCYYDMLEQLKKLCQGITVTIPRSILAEDK